MEGSVTLIIKAANQSVPDQRLDCDSEWSVLHLKDHLSTVHPSKPRVDEQRLIYSGQLLLDNLLLRNVLRHPTENNSYTIHLVCSPPRPYPSARLQASSGVPPRRQSLPGSPVSRNQDPSILVQGEGNMNEGPAPAVPPEEASSLHAETPASQDTSDGLRRRNVGNSSGEVATATQQSIDPPAAYHHQPQVPNSTLQTSADSMHQMAAMQQMYAQYMAYIQFMQMGGGMGGLAWPQQIVQFPAAPNPATSTTTATTTAATATPTVEQGDLQQPPQEQNLPPDPQLPQQQPQIRMNAQGGEVEDDDDDEGMGRDWLDWIYVLSRIVVLLSIVYFYSTVSRFMIVICIAMLLYLYQAGWFRPARRVEQAREANENNDNIQDERNNNVNNNNNNNNNELLPDQRNQNEEEEEAAASEVQENAAANEDGNTDGTDPVVEEIPLRPSFLALTWTFLTAFFTSLIPEQPQVI